MSSTNFTIASYLASRIFSLAEVIDYKSDIPNNRRWRKQNWSNHFFPDSVIALFPYVFQFISFNRPVFILHHFIIFPYIILFILRIAFMSAYTFVVVWRVTALNLIHTFISRKILLQILDTCSSNWNSHRLL